MRRLSFKEMTAVFVSLIVIIILFGLGQFFFPSQEEAETDQITEQIEE